MESKVEKDDRIHVLAVVTSLGAGGLETYLVNLLSVIDRSKYHFKIVYTTDKSTWYSEELEKMGIESDLCPNSYTQLPFIWRIYNIIKQGNFDAVCDFRSDFGAPTMIAAWLAGVKTRIALYRSTNRCFKPDFLRNIYSTMIHSITRHLATRIIGNSSSVMESFYPACLGRNEKYAIVYNGVDLQKFAHRDSSFRQQYGIDKDKLVIGHVGRFNSAKNHNMIVEIFAELKRQIRNVHLVLVGDGELRPVVEAKISALGLEKDVTFTGKTKNVAEILNGMDVFIFPSIYEGHPNGLVEAMSCGLPFVASDIPEIRETAGEELSGQLCRVDDLNCFADKLALLCSDEQKRSEIGLAAQKHARDRYNLDDSAKKFCSFLSDVDKRDS